MITISNSDFELAIKLIESEIGYKFSDLKNKEHYFLAGQSLASAILYIKKIVPFFCVNDVDLFLFDEGTFAKRKKSYGISRKSYYISKSQSKTKLDMDEEKDNICKYIYSRLQKETSEDKLIQEFEDYFYSKNLRTAITIAINIKEGGDITKIPDYGIIQSNAVNYDYADHMIRSLIEKYVEEKYSDFKITSLINDFEDCNSLRVISSKEEDVFNIITYYCGKRNGSTINYYSFLDKFDINMVQVGYDFNQKRGYFTRKFIEFLNTRDIRMTNVKSPYHTIIRLFKKQEEFRNTRLHCNNDLNSQIVSQIMSFESEVYSEIFFGFDATIKNNIFGYRYIDKQTNKDLKSFFETVKVNNKKDKKAFYKLESRAIDNIKFIEDKSHVNSLNLVNEDYLKLYPKLLTQILPDLVYRDFYSKKRVIQGVSESLNNKLENIPLKDKKKTFTDNEIKNIIEKYQFYFNDTHNINKLINLLRAKFGSHMSFIHYNIMTMAKSFIINSYQDAIDIFEYISSLDELIIGSLENKETLFPIYCNTKEYEKDNNIDFIKAQIKQIYDDIMKDLHVEYSIFDFDKIVLGDYCFKYLNTPYKLIREGREMKHCIGGMAKILPDKHVIPFSVKHLNKAKERGTFHFKKISSSKFKLSQYNSYENQQHQLTKEMYYSTVALIDKINNLNLDFEIDKHDFIRNVRISYVDCEDYIEENIN